MKKINKTTPSVIDSPMIFIYEPGQKNIYFSIVFSFITYMVGPFKENIISRVVSKSQPVCFQNFYLSSNSFDDNFLFTLKFAFDYGDFDGYPLQESLNSQLIYLSAPVPVHRILIRTTTYVNKCVYM